MAPLRLADLSRERRLALGLFLVLLVGFYGLSQVKLITAVGEGGGYPGAREVLVKYHGDPTRSLLHKVLDPTRPKSDPKNMYQYLGGSDADVHLPALLRVALDELAGLRGGDRPGTQVGQVGHQAPVPPTVMRAIRMDNPFLSALYRLDSAMNDKGLVVRKRFDQVRGSAIPEQVDAAGLIAEGSSQQLSASLKLVLGHKWFW